MIHVDFFAEKLFLIGKKSLLLSPDTNLNLYNVPIN